MRRAIVKLDYYGNYLQELRLDSLAGLDGLAVYSGHVLALDAKSRRLFVLTTNGEPVTALSLGSSLQAKATNTLDIAIAGKMLYILDGAAGEIHCFHIQNDSR
jgi:hypothetical protein